MDGRCMLWGSESYGSCASAVIPEEEGHEHEDGTGQMYSHVMDGIDPDHCAVRASGHTDYCTRTLYIAAPWDWVWPCTLKWSCDHLSVHLPSPGSRLQSPRS